MKKGMKIASMIIIVVLLFVVFIGFYVGNYLYEYTLDRYSTHNIADKIFALEEVSQESRLWLDENSEDVEIISQDHLKLHGYLIEQKSSAYVIMVHGYHSDSASLVSPIKKMKNQGYNVLAIDLRGHGQSEGDYIGMGWDDRKDVLLWIDYILQRKKDSSIILYGVSMGGATVMNVAGEKLPSQVKAVIEDCGYTSVWDIFKTHIDMNEFQSEVILNLGSFVTRMRAGYSLRDVSPLRQVQKSQIPILFIHGDQDAFVPCEMVDELYQKANCPKEKLIIHGAGHAGSWAMDPKDYYETIWTFIEKYT